MKSYEAVYHQLEAALIKGQYPPGTYLPSENELSKKYGVSRDTIRKALGMLMEAGFIQKRQGKGSIVIKREQLRFPISGLTSFQELQSAYGYESTTQVNALEQIIIDEELSKKTGFATGESAWSLTRTRSIDGKKVILDKDLLLKKFVPQLNITTVKDSLYRYLESDLKLNIAYAEKEITIDSLHQEDLELLDLAPHDINIVSIKSRVYLADASQFQYTESRHQVDKFRFADFARRKNSAY